MLFERKRKNRKKNEEEDISLERSKNRKIEENPVKKIDFSSKRLLNIYLFDW